MPDGAVITGDLIGSRKAGKLATDAAMSAIKATATWLTGTTGAATFQSRYRGDGWQILLLKPHLALRLTLAVTATLRREKLPLTRFAVAIDEIGDQRAPNLGAESGPAFVLSGETLDLMPRKSAFGIASMTRAIDKMTSAAARLTDGVARNWTPEQAEAVLLALDTANPTGAEMAAKLEISKPAVSYRLQGANWWDIKVVIEAFEEKMDTQHD